MIIDDALEGKKAMENVIDCTAKSLRHSLRGIDSSFIRRIPKSNFSAFDSVLVSESVRKKLRRTNVSVGM